MVFGHLDERQFQEPRTQIEITPGRIKRVDGFDVNALIAEGNCCNVGLCSKQLWLAIGLALCLAVSSASPPWRDTSFALMLLSGPQVVLAQNSPQDQTQGSVPEQVKNGLEKSGFTNIEGMPDAVLVQAIDPHGNSLQWSIPILFKDMTNESGIVHPAQSRADNQ
jgi:hypothetical protein